MDGGKSIQTNAEFIHLFILLAHHQREEFMRNVLAGHCNGSKIKFSLNSPQKPMRCKLGSLQFIGVHLRQLQTGA